MESKYQKGLFRIYIVENAITAVVTVVYLVKEENCYFTPPDMIEYWNGYWPGLTIMLLCCAVPWVVHYTVKWIIRGFKGGNHA